MRCKTRHVQEKLQRPHEIFMTIFLFLYISVCGFKNAIMAIKCFISENNSDGIRNTSQVGCRDGAVARARAYHQCGPGSIP